MSKLVEQTCEACRIDAPPLDDAQLDEVLQELPEWQVVTTDGVNRLVRQYRCKDFKAAMSFANAVAELAEQYHHHPALTIEWGKTTIQWWTHKIGGLHHNDAVMAAKTEAVIARQLQVV